MPEAVSLARDRSKVPDGPYPGLRPFEPHEWSIFFGREVMTAEVITRLGRQNLIIVHGASGCGKSSLVRAGVLPVLQSDHDLHRRDFRYAVIRPSQGPLEALAAALLAQLGPANGRTLDVSWMDRIAVDQDLVGTIEQRLEGTNATFCLVVDQFEEIFRWAEEKDRAEAEFLVEFLRAVAKRDAGSRNFFVLVTMRSDYLGQCAQFKDFAGTVNDCQYLLDNLDEFGILRAIHEPAEQFGGRVDAALADRLRFIAKDDPDALPVLQHTLMRMYEALPDREPGWTLGLAALDAASGETGPLSEHAEAIYQETVQGSAARAAAVEWMFRALTDLDAGGRAIRRPCLIDELVAVSGTDAATVREIVDAFSRSGRNFLVLTASERGTQEVDIGHEALIRRWRRIGDSSVDPDTGLRSGWLYREFQAGLTWKALAVLANRGDTTLEPAMTRQWLPFFDEVETRPAWAARYFVDPLPGIAPVGQPEWTKVMALITASRARLERDSQRWRRVLVRSWAYLVAGFLLFVVLGTLYGMNLARRAKASEDAAARAERSSAAARRRARDAEVAAATVRQSAAYDAQRLRAAASEVEAAARENARQAQADAARIRLAARRTSEELARRVELAALSTQAVLQSLTPPSQREEGVARVRAAEQPVPLPRNFRAGLRRVILGLANEANDKDPIADEIERLRVSYGLTTVKRLAAFLAIAAIDTDHFRESEDILDISDAESIRVDYGARLSPGATPGSFIHRPEALANEAYGGRLGNSEAGDGWRFRGRGLIFIRGRAAYQEMDARLPIELMSNPDLLSTPTWAVRAGLERWRSREGNNFADSGQIFSLWRWISGIQWAHNDMIFLEEEELARTLILRALELSPSQNP